MRWLYPIVLVVAACSEEEPLFPENWSATYNEVRTCRSSSDHDLHRIRRRVTARHLPPPVAPHLVLPSNG